MVVGVCDHRRDLLPAELGDNLYPVLTIDQLELIVS